MYKTILIFYSNLKPSVYDFFHISSETFLASIVFPDKIKSSAFISPTTLGALCVPAKPQDELPEQQATDFVL